MKAAFERMSPRGWFLKTPDWLDQQTVASLTFAAKTFAASLLALYIAFWAGLDDPRWSFLTVYIVSQPDSGLVLAKSFYRILGTMAGLIVSITLVFGLAQYGELFVAATAAWICFCNFAARAARNFASYGLQLAGYTVAVIGIPAALEPAAAYPLVLARFTEILLGIVCAALFSRLFLLRELSPKLVESVRALTRRADSLATVQLDSEVDRERVADEWTGLVKANLEVQDMQHSTYFESAEARVLDQPLRRLTQAAVDLCAMAETAASHRAISLHANESPADDSPMVSALIRAADERDLGLARARLQESMAAFDRGEELPEPKIAGALWSDPIPAVLTGIRSTLAVLITSALWFATAWPNGPVAVGVAAVVCSLLASRAQPDKLSMAVAATILVAAVPVFATQYYLLPLAVDFPSMAVALAPLMLACAFIMAQPRIGALGLLSVVYFTFASSIDNVMTYNIVSFLNSSLAILVGIAVTVVLFATFFPETPASASRRFHRQLFVHLSYLTNARSCGPALRCYQRALFEQLGATLAHLEGDPKVARQCLESALAALSVAQAVSRLKSGLDRTIVAPGIAAEGARLLARLSQTLRNPSVGRFSKRASEARALSRHALATARNSSESKEIKALSEILVGSATLVFDLVRVRVVLQGKSNAVAI